MKAQKMFEEWFNEKKEGEAYKELTSLGFTVERYRGNAGELCIDLYHKKKQYVINCISRRDIRGFQDGFYYLVDFTRGNFIHIDKQTHKAISLLMKELGWIE